MNVVILINNGDVVVFVVIIIFTGVRPTAGVHARIGQVWKMHIIRDVFRHLTVISELHLNISAAPGHSVAKLLASRHTDGQTDEGEADTRTWTLWCNHTR